MPLSFNLLNVRVGRFLLEGGKNVFSVVKTGLAKIVFVYANKNLFLPELSSK